MGQSPLCDISYFVGFLTGPWTVTHSSLCRVCRVIAGCLAMGPVRIFFCFICVYVGPSTWSAVAVAGAAGVVDYFPCRVLDSHPLFPV